MVTPFFPSVSQPVYVKDEFFDSLSCNTFDGEPKKGWSKFSEQKKLDAEVVFIMICSSARFIFGY